MHYPVENFGPPVLKQQLILTVRYTSTVTSPRALKLFHMDLIQPSSPAYLLRNQHFYRPTTHCLLWSVESFSL